MTLDGLTQLENKRNEASARAKKSGGVTGVRKGRSRDVPPPDHTPPPLEPSPTEQVRPVTSAHDPDSTITRHVVATQPKKARPLKPATTSSDMAGKGGHVRPLTVYLDPERRAQLNQITAIAIGRGESYSASAVMRLAMDRLLSDMTSEDVVAALAERRQAELDHRQQLRTENGVDIIVGRPRA